MNQHVPGSLVSGFEPLIEGIALPDPNDRHVVATAIQTRAEAIITFNLKDFPDEFVSNLMDLNIGAVIEAARCQRASLKNPPFTASDFLDLLQKQKLPSSVSRLRPFEMMI
ncbi:hypothetical protein [Spartinivicinus poritis]|uniref:VapC50 C-terminal domain-containing protein n=1 Tax=Spartinivicinus poritis TaxID=2994640 RepID=A0ABT5ULV9_9GAMM|nr:hypothetical protein [Spartinivicinus sp. A2-2]MDE1466004.1 hypothetical protein [Spartinivicinus sp. A2-2]